MHFAHMKKLAYVPIAPGKAVGAWLCLTAVLLLWAPMWASAWAARGMSCCAGNMCAAHGHGKASFSGKGAAAKDEAPMECEHSHSPGMAACSMSCCHEQSSSLVSGTVYVLPNPAVILLPTATTNSAVAVNDEEVFLVFAPPFPPPKSSLL
jgi:hypothetical protein